MAPGAMSDHKGEAAALPANLMRTMPYTAYVAVGSYAVVFASPGAAWLQLGLIINEVLNAAEKALLKRVVGSESRMLRRPEGAMDSGIYPQHFPRTSHTSGMPSGHSQASTFLAVLMSCAVLQQSGDLLATGDGGQQLSSSPQVALQLGYIWLLALMVIVSRTRFAGPLAVKVDGRRVAHHTVLQVVVGATLGVFLGLAAWSWHEGRSWVWWVLSACLTLFLICVVALLEARASSHWASPSESDDNDKLGSTDSDRSTDGGGSSDRSTEEGSSTSEIELRSRPPSRGPNPARGLNPSAIAGSTTSPGYAPMTTLYEGRG